MAVRNAGINPVTDWPAPTMGRAPRGRRLSLGDVVDHSAGDAEPASEWRGDHASAVTTSVYARAAIRPARCSICRVMDPAANVSTGTGVNAVSHPALTDEAVARFQRLGFLVVTGLTTLGDLETVSRLLAGLYRRFHELAGARRAHDLGSEQHNARPILEINQTVDLEPLLADTLTFKRCAALAERLLGRAVEYRFDHAIYKPAFNGAATSWHQDEAYALERKILSAHFWVPLQDVTRDMGCMEFIPGSHRGVLWRHHRRDRLRDTHALEVVGLDTSQAVPFPIRAGDATVHFPRTVHYTGPNHTGTPRLAWALEFGPRRALGVRLMAKARLVWRRATR